MVLALRRGVVILSFFLASCMADTFSVANESVNVSLPDTVVVSLAMQQTSLTQSDDFKIHFTITNHSSESFTVLPWGTPLETVLSADVFEVTHNGTELPYVGRIVKRAAPVKSDYIHISPGEKITAIVNLSYGYVFDAVGVYQVQLRTEGGKYRAHGDLLPVASQPLVIERY